MPDSYCPSRIKMVLTPFPIRPASFPIPLTVSPQPEMATEIKIKNSISATQRFMTTSFLTLLPGPPACLYGVSRNEDAGASPSRPRSPFFLHTLSSRPAVSTLGLSPYFYTNARIASQSRRGALLLQGFRIRPVHDEPFPIRFSKRAQWFLALPPGPHHREFFRYFFLRQMPLLHKRRF